MKRLVHLMFVVFASLVLLGCAKKKALSELPTSDVPLQNSHLTHEQVIFIAQEAAKRAGIKLANYKDSTAHFEFTRKDKTWSVCFDGQVPVPGNHFSVWVDDQTSQTKVWRGE